MVPKMILALLMAILLTFVSQAQASVTTFLLEPEVGGSEVRVKRGHGGGGGGGGGYGHGPGRGGGASGPVYICGYVGGKEGSGYGGYGRK